jgi:hypothetical protein
MGSGSLLARLQRSSLDLAHIGNGFAHGLAFGGFR